MSTTRSLMLVALLAATAPLRAQEWEGAWRVEPTGSRTVERTPQGLTLSVEWPGRGAVTLQGAAGGDALRLTARTPATPGLVGALDGREVAPPVELALDARRVEDGPDGARAEVTFREGRRVVRQERWRRPAPASVELVAVAPRTAWTPKTEPLTLRFRVRGAPLALKLRVALDPQGKDDRRVTFYGAQLGHRRNDGLPTRIVVFEADLAGGAPFEPGEHSVTWDGRDDTAARRLLLGGPLRVALVGDGARADGRVDVAPPGCEYLAPTWPRLKEEEPYGRFRRSAVDAATPGIVTAGFAPPASNLRQVTEADCLEAMARSAQVTFASHGNVGTLALYLGPEGPEDLAVADNVHHFTASRVKGFARERGGKPFRDLHTVVIWACLVGQVTPEGLAAAKLEGRRAVASLPAELLARGVDVVVSFKERIVSTTHDRFLRSLFARALEREAATDPRPGELKSVHRVALEAAQDADRGVWNPKRPGEVGDPNAQLKALWGAFPAEDCIVVDTAPGIDPAVEPLAPARWGNSTN